MGGGSDDEPRASRTSRERRDSEFDEVFRHTAPALPRERVDRPSRWHDPAPTSGVWDPRGATPQQRREVYEKQLRWRRVWIVLLTIFGVANVGVILIGPDESDSMPFSALTWANIALAGLVYLARQRAVLGDDPEEPVEHLQERMRHLLRRVIYPTLAVLNLTLGALVLVVRSAAWPFAVVLGLAFLVAWWRARRTTG